MLCTGEGARFRVLKKIALTKIGTAAFWRFKFFFLQCIASRLVKLYYQRPAIHTNCSAELTIEITAAICAEV